MLLACLEPNVPIGGDKTVVKTEAERRESYDQSRATWLRIVADRRGHHDGKFAGDEKRSCRAVGSRSKGQSAEDAGSIAEP